MKRSLSRRRFIASLGLACAGVVAAEPAGPADAASSRAVVQAQLDAFAVDDALAAFALAAPELREMFGNADRFIAMVRAAYPVVYRPASTTFLAPVWVSGVLLQGVQLTDAAGALWLAVYRLQRQPDSSWRISGCDLAPARGRAT